MSTINENEKVENVTQGQVESGQVAGLTKMQSATKKAWETIRARKKLEQEKTGQAVVEAVKQEIKKEKKVKQKKVKEEKAETEGLETGTISVKEKKELAELNGDEMKVLAKGNGKRVDKNDIHKQYKKVAGEGYTGADKTVKGIQVGAIIESKLNLVEGKAKEQA